MARLLYRETPARPGLAHAIDCLWSVSISPEGTGRPSHWVLPDGCYSLAVGIQPAFYVNIREPVLKPFRAPCQNDEEIAGIRFRPGVNPHAAIASLRRRLRAGQTADEIFAMVQDAVRDEAPDPERRIDRMVSIVREAGGRIKLPDVAEAVQLSSRHLERLCWSTVGITPKGFGRVTRLQALVRSLIAKPDARLADCAAEFGFTDQTHMTREFSALGHLTPAAYLRMIRDVGFLLENRSTPA